MTTHRHRHWLKPSNEARLMAKGFISALIIALTVGGTCKADAILTLNNIEQQTENTYTTNGSDPFVIFKLDASERVRKNQVKANHIILDLSLVEPNNVDELAVEVFFRLLDIDSQPLNNRLLFDPLYRLKLTVPSTALEAQSGKLAIALPEDVVLNADQEIRIDIDGCNKCVMQINRGPRLVSQPDTSIPDANQVFAYRVFNGAKSMPPTGVGLDTQNWHLNNIVRVNNSLKVDGNDPYLVSHDLDLNTQELGGVLFTLNFQNPSNEPRDYQLFYATDRHAFVENASSAVRVSDEEQGISRFVIPLQFLSESHPRVRIVERLRLDLLPSQDDIGTWSFAETTLLSKAQMAEYSKWIPARTIHTKRQRAQGVRLIVNVLKKILSDPWFVIFYVLLITLTAMGFWRQFRR